MSSYLSETQHNCEEEVNTEKLEVEVEELVWRKVEDADPSAKDTEPLMLRKAFSRSQYSNEQSSFAKL